MHSKTKYEQGFSLIELVITITILGILAAVAIPAYNSQKLKGNRTEAISALTEAAQMQQRWYSDNGTYTSDADDIDMPATTETGKYTLAVNSSDSETFTVTATATSNQVADTNCRTFSLDQAGRKTSTDSGGSASTGCWPN